MMVRFSCFPGHMHSHKQKKTVQSSAEAMQKTLEDGSKSHAMKDFTYLSATSPLRLEEKDVLKNDADHATDSSSLEHGCKSEEFNNISDTEFEVKVHKTAQIRKSQSLGSGLHLKGSVASCNDSEDESIQRFSCDETHDHRGSLAADAKEFDTSLLDLIQESGPPGSSLLVNSDLANNESIFSVGDQKESEKSGNENSDSQLSNPNESGGHTPCTQFLIRSSSLPNIHSTCWHNTHNFRRSRSTEDLNILDARRKENLMDEMGNKVMKLKGETTLKDNEKVTGETPTDDKFDTCNYVGSAKEWIVPVTDELNMNEHPNGDFSFHQSNELQSKNFRTNRIEEWVTNLQHCGTFEETNAFSISDDDPELQKGIAVLDNSPVAKLDGKVDPGMETVKKYISSLSANASSAQLVNHGLVVIPFLSAFVSLRALNLSGNTIVRITAGALPRGLHFLNLSRNKISVIEGLRELTRLRVLDLSYNRLVRIGHGLASCSSLKELYLAGNKISEVEGLHRLLKLAVLDLRFNKISTAKCLSQLAANYSSLQAISLEGNPAQKNVGDEQLKKYLQGLLPNLIYFNRQPIKAGALKDTSDRSARLGIGAHQIDRGLKADLKNPRKGSHGVATHKVSSSTILGRKSQPTNTAKPSMSSRHVGLPPSGTKATTNQRQPIYDSSSKLRIFRSDLSMRRSRSEGTLGAL